MNKWAPNTAGPDKYAASRKAINDAFPVPDLMKGRVVPSTIQAWGETFHREQNLDEWFGALCAVVDAAKGVVHANGQYCEDDDDRMRRLKETLEALS